MELGGQPSTPRSLRIRIRSGGFSQASPSTGSKTGRTQIVTPSKLLSPSLHSLPFSHDSISSNKKYIHQKRTNDLDSLVEGRIGKVFGSLPVSKYYSLVKQIGEGTFSTVYLVDRNKDCNQSAKSDEKLALKHLIPTSKPARVVMEIKCLQAAAGHPNIVPLRGMWRIGGDVILAMPYIKHCKFVELVSTMDLAETRLYLGNLLSALQHIHKLGLIHRDIKPSNFLYDRENKRFALVDFGLAQYESELAGGTVGRGTKRKGEEERETPGKRRAVLSDCESKLNCSPRTRILRDYKQSVRRSPRKHDINSQETEMSSPRDVPRHKLSFGTPLGPATPTGTPLGPATPTGIVAMTTSPTPTPSPSNNMAVVRCSPRKLTPLARPAGFSKLTITGSAILSECQSIPSLPRTPSFTMLEPASYTEMSGATSRTPLLRASVSSHCSSTLPRPAPAHHVSHVAPSCYCAGQLATCPGCLALPHIHAARAGTPGFRPPEVLLKYPVQTTAVDLWAVGIILLCMLSRSYPFFRAPDDMTALAELSSLLGTAQIQAAAKKYNRKVIASHSREAPDLGDLCRRLSMRGEPKSGDSTTSPILATDEAVSLLKMLLRLDHRDRITAAEALSHPFLTDIVN